MHVALLLAPRLDNENHTKDIDFSPAGMRRRWGKPAIGIPAEPWSGRPGRTGSIRSRG